MKIGFIGLGRMGQSMALNLLHSGAELMVFDANAQAAEPLVNDGAVLAASVAEMASQVGVLFTSLPGPVQVEEVILGSGGVAENMSPNLVVFDLSTSSASLARRINTALQAKGGAMLDAPISGGPAGAASGELAIWVGGDKDAYDTHLHLLTAIGNNPRHVGVIGTGTVIKLTHNLLACMILISLGEAFSIGTKAGVDPLDLWEAMKPGVVGRKTPLDMLTAQFLPGRYEPPAFALKGAHKDVALATAMARELGVPLRVGNLTMEEMTEALGRGFGEQDSRAFLKLQLERAGVEIAVDPDRLAAAIEAAQ